VLNLTLPRMVHAEPVALRDRGYYKWDEPLDHIGNSSFTASPGCLLAELTHAPAGRKVLSCMGRWRVE
jgi:hypothetical protein